MATFAAGETSVLVRTPISTDTIDEGDETFTLTATTSAGTTSNASAEGTATITDDDDAPTLTVSSPTVADPCCSWFAAAARPTEPGCSSASGLSATGLDDNLRAFADLPESLKHLGPDRLLTRAARARNRDLHLIWLFPCCIVGPEAGDHAGRYEAVKGHIDQTALGAIALRHQVPPITASEVTESNIDCVTMSAKSFTERQGQYLAFIDAYTRVHGRPPAETDMQRHFQLSPPSVRLGHIRRQPGVARSIEVLLAPQDLPVLRHPQQQRRRQRSFACACGSSIDGVRATAGHGQAP